MQKATHSTLPALRRASRNFILKQKNLIYKLTPYSLRSVLIASTHSRTSQALFPTEVSETLNCEYRKSVTLDYTASNCERINMVWIRFGGSTGCHKRRGYHSTSTGRILYTTLWKLRHIGNQPEATLRTMWMVILQTPVVLWIDGRPFYFTCRTYVYARLT